MASGLDVLSTLGFVFLALAVYRLLVLRFIPKRSYRIGGSNVTVSQHGLMSLGSLIILITGLSLLFAQIVSSGADIRSPIVPSIQVGVLYGVMGIGLTLTYSVVKLPNFAHGEMVTIGAYTMAVTSTVLRFPLPLAFGAAAVTGAGLGAAQHLLVYRPLINRGAKLVQIMIASFALSLVIRSIYWIFAAEFNVVQYHPVSENLLPCSPTYNYLFFRCGEGILKYGQTAVTDLFFWSILTTAVLAVLLYLLLTRTMMGKSMRAVADNVELSQVTGINVGKIRLISWLITGALTGVGGAFFGIKFAITPELGWTSLLRVFAAVTLGGLVSFSGTLIGGLVVGFGEQWVIIVAASNYHLSVTWQAFVAFLIIVVVLLVRPEGLTKLNIRNPLAILYARVKSVRLRPNSS